MIAPGDQVVKDAAFRDRLRKDYGALCVGTEAAGLMNGFPCLVTVASAITPIHTRLIRGNHMQPLRLLLMRKNC